MAPPVQRISFGVAALAGLLGGQVMWVVNRPLPSLEGMDASGVEGPDSGIELRMAVLGDSTCTGPGLDRPGDIWVRRLARSLTPRFRVEVHSLAQGGAKAVDVVRHQLQPARDLAPDLALVSVGGNDVLRGVTVGAFRRHLTEIVAALTPVARVVMLSGVGDMGTIPRLPHPLADIARLRGRAFNRVHHELGRDYQVLVADQWSSFGNDRSCSLPIRSMPPPPAMPSGRRSPTKR